MKPIGQRICIICGKRVDVYHKERMNREVFTCSLSCLGRYNSKSNEFNCECDFCGKNFHKKPSEIHKRNYCSRICFANAKKEYMKGSGNHQFGLKGSKNPTWKSDEKLSPYGYRLIRSLHHPFRNTNDYVFEHRLVAEKYLLNDDNSIEIDGKLYLSPKYEVHHINENKLDNRPENLVVLTKSEHIRLHNFMKPREKDEFGRFKKG